ncbi:MAG: glycosyltransferase [Rhodospirillaceae bacterium]
MAHKISLITPTFNRVSTLAATLASVEHQRGRFDLQYVVIDGGSTDGTLDLLHAKKGLISDYVSEPDGGMYDAIAKGFARTDGEILGWLNSDDTLFPWAFDLITRIFDDVPQIQWISTLTQAAIDADGDIRYLRKVPGYAQQAFFDGVYFGFGGAGDRHATEFIQQESTFFRRSLWARAGEPALRSASLAGDFALWTAFMAEAPLVGVDAPLGAFRIHSAGQLSRGQRETYVQQCKAALTAARTKLNYVPRVVEGSASYTGIYAEKRFPEQERSSWHVVERPFHVLPRGDLKTALNQRLVF